MIGLIPDRLTKHTEVLFRGEVAFVDLAGKPHVIVETPMAYYYVPACDFDREVKKHSILRVGKDDTENYLE